MNKLLLIITVTCSALILSSGQLNAQGTDNYGAGLKINLDTTGRKFVRILTWHQVWVRYNENNPGSTVNGQATSSQMDMSLRRSRFLVYSQINPDFLILTHFGINNANQISGGALGQGASGTDGKKPQLFLHDAYVEHRVYKDAVSIGGGLHYWQGPSRMTGTSTLNFMTMDSPIFSWENIDATDQFARQYGIYLKGKLLENKRLDYRVAVNFPFGLAKGHALGALDTVSARQGLVNSSYRLGGQPKNAFTGYFSYQFKDIESNLLPFNVGTYLGTKKVFNVGAGFYQQKDGVWSVELNEATNKVDTVNHNQLHVSVDAFLDLPLGSSKKTALTVYASYNYVNMGKNFLRNVGVNNPANGGVASQLSYNGTGNAVPLIGTGNVYYMQAGIALPKSAKLGRIQPYVATIFAQYDRLADNLFIPDIGLNWYLAGHSAKVTLNYRARPVFVYENPAQRWSNVVQDGTKSECTLQLQVYL